MHPAPRRAPFQSFGVGGQRRYIVSAGFSARDVINPVVQQAILDYAGSVANLRRELDTKPHSVFSVETSVHSGVESLVRGGVID